MAVKIPPSLILLDAISLDDLGDITITAPADGDVLIYNSINSAFENSQTLKGGTF